MYKRVYRAPCLHSNSSSTADSRSYWKCFLVNAPFISQRTSWVCCTGRVGVEGGSSVHCFVHSNLLYLSVMLLLHLWRLLLLSSNSKLLGTSLPGSAQSLLHAGKLRTEHRSPPRPRGSLVDRKQDGLLQLGSGSSLCVSDSLTNFDEFSALLIFWCLCQIWFVFVCSIKCPSPSGMLLEWLGLLLQAFSLLQLAHPLSYLISGAVGCPYRHSLDAGAASAGCSTTRSCSNPESEYVPVVISCQFVRFPGAVPGSSSQYCTSIGHSIKNELPPENT